MWNDNVSDVTLERAHQTGKSEKSLPKFAFNVAKTLVNVQGGLKLNTKDAAFMCNTELKSFLITCKTWKRKLSFLYKCSCKRSEIFHLYPFGVRSPISDHSHYHFHIHLIIIISKSVDHAFLNFSQFQIH